MRTMKDSGLSWVGEIPSDWVAHPVYYYFGERKNKNIFGQEDNLLSLSYGRVIRKDINTNGGLLPESFNTYNIVEAGDIIIRPTDLQNDKKSLRTGLCLERGIITSAYIALRPIRRLNSGFFRYLLHAYDISKVFYNMGNGVRQGLNFSEFSRLTVFEPPIEIQDKVTQYLDTATAEVDKIISDIQTQIDTLEQYKRSVITETVTRYTPKFSLRTGKWENSELNISDVKKYAEDGDARLVSGTNEAAARIIFKTGRDKLPCALIYRDANSLPMFDALAERFNNVMFGKVGDFTVNMTDAQRYSSSGKTSVDYIFVMVSENNIESILK